MEDTTMNLTLIKEGKNGVTFRKISIEEFVESLRSEAYLPQLQPLRSYYPALQATLHPHRALVEAVYRDVPEVCFAAELFKRNGGVEVRQFNGLLALTVDNLPNMQTAIRVRQEASHLPLTHLCCLSATGRGVLIVCRLEWGADRQPATEEQMQRYLLNAYGRLHYHYSAQLGLTLDRDEPAVGQSFLVSADKDVWFNPDSDAFFVRYEAAEVPEYRTEADGKMPTDRLPGYTSLQSQCEIFEWCLRDALLKAEAKSEVPAERMVNALALLAAYCCESCLPMDFAIRRLQWKPQFSLPQGLVETTFRTAYAERNRRTAPFAHIDKNALLVYQTEAFLRTHYELRRNVMTGVVQYRRLDGYRFGFQDITETVMNSMTNRALKAGIGSWDKDVRRILNSDQVPDYEPLADYLYQLPQWDGRDHVGELFSRIPTRFDQAATYLHTWMLSTVAHWLGKDADHGNALVPLLIGEQGCGKTTFAARLLPPELRDYYNDRVDFRNDTALMLGLTSFALINIDEFDALKPSQQPVLKYLLSKSEVKMRPPFGKTYVQRRRFASFLATTNHLHPLTDPTGSRRFVCIRITPGRQIDFQSPIPYEQIYAQLLCELNEGARYWLNAEETALLTEHNEAYRQLTDIASILSALYRTPEPGEKCQPISIGDIAERVCRSYPNIRPSRGFHVEIGRALSKKECESIRRTSGTHYYLVEK